MLVTARRFSDLSPSAPPLEGPRVVEEVARPLSAPELIEAVAPPREEITLFEGGGLGDGGEDLDERSTG